MKKILCLIAALAVFSTAGHAVPLGILYTDTIETVALGPANSYSKKAEEANFSVLTLIALGQANAELLAKKAGIKEIHRIDKHTFSVLFFYTQETFTVYGN